MRVLRKMREKTVFAALDFSVSLFDYPVIPRTIHVVQRAIAKETIDITITFMAWIIFTFLIGKKPAGVLHFFSLHHVYSLEIYAGVLSRIATFIFFQPQPFYQQTVL